MLTYLDSSALVKLVISEAETASLKRYLSSAQSCATSIVAEVEVGLVARRKAGDEGERTASIALQGLALVDLRAEIRELAVKLSDLRALDAIHVATAQYLVPEIAAFVTYDKRMSEVATALGLPVPDF